MASSFYDLVAKDAKGAELPFSKFKGQVVMIVNVASKCGFTPQYQGLQALYTKFKDQGFTIIGAPCNQFGGQEPGTEAEVVTFCSRNYGVDFPILEKLNVNGGDTHPVYKWIKSQPAGMWFNRVMWNFEKALVDRQGNLVARYRSTTTPASLEAEVQKLLAQDNAPAAAAAEAPRNDL